MHALARDSTLAANVHLLTCTGSLVLLRQPHAGMGDREASCRWHGSCALASGVGESDILTNQELVASPAGPLSSSDLMTIVGRGASDAGGRGNVGIGDGSLSFVVAPAAAVPGGPQVCARSRACASMLGQRVASLTCHMDLQSHAHRPSLPHSFPRRCC